MTPVHPALPRCRGIARPSPNCLFATGLSQAAGLSLTGCDAVKVKADAAIGLCNGQRPMAQSATLVLLAKNVHRRQAWRGRPGQSLHTSRPRHSILTNRSLRHRHSALDQPAKVKPSNRLSLPVSAISALPSPPSNTSVAGLRALRAAVDLRRPLQRCRPGCPGCPHWVVERHRGTAPRQSGQNSVSNKAVVDCTVDITNGCLRLCYPAGEGTGTSDRISTAGSLCHWYPRRGLDGDALLL